MEGKNKRIICSWYPIVMYSIIFVIIIIYKSFWHPIKITKASEELIYEGIYINQYYVGGLSKEEVINYLNEKLNKEILDKKIKLWNGSIFYEISYKELGVFYPVEKTVDEAFHLGKENTGLVRKTFDRVNIKFCSIKLRINALNNEEKINTYIRKLSARMNSEPIDAKVIFNGKNLEITNEIYGRYINEAELKYCVKKAILYNKSDVIIPFKIIIPKVTSNMLSCSYSNLSSFSTPLLSKNVDRTNNIKIAAAKVNGYILFPGDVFSANKAIGKRTVEKGYKNAPIFQGGKVVPGLAGGICQLVTTIYNTALNANLQILERTRHGQQVNYVAHGMDATIAGDVIDLKFKNTSNYQIYIHAYVDTNSVIVNFYKIDINCFASNSNIFYYKTNNYLLRRTSIYNENEII